MLCSVEQRAHLRAWRGAVSGMDLLSTKFGNEIPSPCLHGKRSDKMNSLAHRNRSDFCDLRLRCPLRTPEIARFPTQDKAMLPCDLRVRSNDLRFRAAISEPKTPSLCGISGDLVQSTRKSLAIAIVRFWCAKMNSLTDRAQ